MDKERIKIAVTTVSFSKNQILIQKLRDGGRYEVRKNPFGKRLGKEELIELLQGCQGAIIGLDQVDESLLKHCPDLRVVSKYGVGLDNIDFEACSKFGVEVFSTQGVNRRSVAEQTLGFMLMLCRNLSRSCWNLKHGIWNKKGGVQLSSKTVGIIGVGNIGKEVIQLLAPFECRVLVNDIVDQHAYYQSVGVEEGSKERIFKEADIITLHVPLTDLTREMIDLSVLKSMKPQAFLINTARGNLIVEEDLKEALKSMEIAGAALDVFAVEPPVDQELIQLDNFLCTPHIGGNAREAVEAMGFAAIANLDQYFLRRGI